ncbi:hypothetical protein [Kutzneria buriramensis]|nr:hypothetical protein [Kutzneria buriramensis]
MAEQVGADLGAIGAILAPFDGVKSEYAGISGGHITVNHDTVLQAGKAIADHWLQLQQITQSKLPDLVVSGMGKDDVSEAAMIAWNEVLNSNPDSYSKRITAYVQGLRQLADNLRAAAQQYGFTEDQVKDAFGALR